MSSIHAFTGLHRHKLTARPQELVGSAPRTLLQLARTPTHVPREISAERIPNVPALFLHQTPKIPMPLQLDKWQSTKRS
jgi:hypothetical protein